ncbi:S8 family serine peptidase [Frankia sp. Ag45/Mut15]|uniref:S8 family serine peptidase n=1 Tax=Frankia umida TaxID=573489 RepID=A0ABT0K0C0_9ACTN|nr:S8 family serine peptidase [Frankia umida]MCK9877231.1 S8 family serine peptidase [Frankia umida]
MQQVTRLPRSPSGTAGKHQGPLLASILLTALLWGSLTWAAAPSAQAATPTPTTTPHRPAGGPTGSTAGGPQWYQSALDLDRVQRISQGAGILVAVIDGGVDATSPKLRGQLVRGAGVGPDAAVDGWRDDDPDGHGTAMAGLVVGRVDGGPAQVRGIAPAAHVLPISTGAEADSAEVAIAVHLAVDLGATIINLSLGSADDPTSDEREAVRYALAHDVIVVASAGNVEPDDPPGDAAIINSPASIPGVVAVTGSTAHGGFWDGSAHGPQAVVAAPAPGIRAPVPTSISADGLDTGSGTSNSAAIVSGVLALLRSAFPELTAANVIERLIRTARDAGPPGRDVEFGFGIIDPLAALTAAVPPVHTSALLAPPTRWGVPSEPPAADASPARPGSQPATADPPALDPAGTNTGTAGPTAATSGGGLDAIPSLLVWTLGTAFAGWLGGVLGLGAHLAHQAHQARRRPRTDQPPVPLTEPYGPTPYRPAPYQPTPYRPAPYGPAPYPEPNPVQAPPAGTSWVPASPGAQSRHF